MKVEKNLEIFNMISSTINFEILNKIYNSNKPIQFKELRFLKNPKTSKNFSTKTISNRLKEFEEIGIIETQSIENTKRKNFGYSMTKKGIETINILKEAEEKYKKINN